MNSLEVRLLGRFSVRCDGQPVPHTEVLKVQELLSYLLVNRARPHHREQLAETLWENNRPDQARKYLRQTLWLLQSALLNSTSPNDPPILTVDAQWVHLNSSAINHVDIIELEQAFDIARDRAAATLTANQVNKIKDAVSLYQSSLLDGWYQDWCLLERERLEMLYLLLLQKLIDYCTDQRRFEEGIWYSHQVLARDAARERTHRQLMYLYAQSGDRTSALRQFERCVSILRDELDVEPSPTTVALAEQIRADRLSTSDAGSTPSYQAPHQPPPTSLSDAAKRLFGIHARLNEVALQLEHEIGELQRNGDRQIR